MTLVASQVNLYLHMYMAILGRCIKTLRGNGFIQNTYNHILDKMFYSLQSSHKKYEKCLNRSMYMQYNNKCKVGGRAIVYM